MSSKVGITIGLFAGSSYCQQFTYNQFDYVEYEGHMGELNWLSNLLNRVTVGCLSVLLIRIYILNRWQLHISYE